MQNSILKYWNYAKTTAVGRKIFSVLIGFYVPYSGSVSPNIQELSAGRAVLSIREKWLIRNHLKSVHAIALANVGELSSGLAMLGAIPSNCRGIVKNINIEYIKKARGVITAKGSAPEISNIAQIAETVEKIAIAEMFDSSNELVARMEVLWQLGPKPETKA